MAQLTKTQRIIEASKRKAKEFVGTALLAGSLMLAPACDNAVVKVPIKPEAISVSKAEFDPTLCPKAEIKSVFDLAGANYVVLDKNEKKGSDKIKVLNKGGLAFKGSKNGIGNFVYTTEPEFFSNETKSKDVEMPVQGAVSISVDGTKPVTFQLCALSESGQEAALATSTFLAGIAFGDKTEFRATDFPRKEEPKKK